ncbi:MAG: hypothetical protein Q9178_000146 [Gyalolechia marmorata]
MVGEAPDPKTFGSWQDAFQYRIAAVRAMEKQLGNDINSNRDKLRSLVGASYRDLLGTAESIIEMDGQMQQVESYLGDMGRRCNSRLLEKKAVNLKALGKDGRTIAKILVISRLLHKKLSQSRQPPPYLEVLRSRLAGLRRRLLIDIDRRFQSLDSSESVLVEAMCAFSLATSSSSTDVLRHFHHVRQSAMSELGQRRSGDKGISKSLRLVVRTLKDCRTIFPTPLARALETLKATPLLQGSDVRFLREMNLDIHQRWLGDDVASFTPYIRHADLQKIEASRLLEQWAKNAFSSFLKHLCEIIEDFESPAVVVQLRQEVLELWLSNKRHVISAGTFDVLDGIRKAFNNRLQNFIYQKTASLNDISSSVATLLRDWENTVSDTCPPMWDDAIISMDTGSGGKALRDALYTRAYGRSKAVAVVSAAYTTWLENINSLQRLITQLQEKKWADELYDMDDDDETLEDLHNMLSEDDPHLLHETFKNDLIDNFQALRGTIQSHVEKLQPNEGDDVVTAHKSAFLLRVWRDITSRLPSMCRDYGLEAPFIRTLQIQISGIVLQTPISQCDKRIGRYLHRNQLQARILWEGDPQLPVLPSPWAFRLLHETVTSMADFGVDIWTSQATNILKQEMRDSLAPIVKKLQELPRQVNSHDANGESDVKDEEDSQSPGKGGGKDIQEGEGDQNYEAKDGEKESGKETKNGIKEDRSSTQKPAVYASNLISAPSEEVWRDTRIQRLFDALYLDYALNVKLRVTSPDDPDNNPENNENATLPDLLESAQNNILDELNIEDVAQWNCNLRRMRKDAEVYWKRTELLFALLA